MSDDAVESHLREWRAADPQRAVAWLFLTADERIRCGALAALQDEWLKAIRTAGAPEVAVAKLGWWREELPRAIQGQARHPLARALFGDASVCAIPSPCWMAAVDAALLAINRPPASDFATQWEASRPLAEAFADLETRVWFGARARSPGAAPVVLAGYLVANLRAFDAELGAGRSPLPMQLLARHQLGTDDLSRDGPARRAALREYVAELKRALDDAVTMPGPLGLLRALQAQRDLDALGLAAHADEPLAALRRRPHGFRNLLKTWRAARTWREMSQDGRPA